jgi:hypothetical protein
MTYLAGSGATKERIIDYYFLACIYHSTSGISWTNSSEWITNPNVCEWNGVMCYLEDLSPPQIAQQLAQGRVLQIVLASNQLDGLWPPKGALIGDTLVTIDVYDNLSLDCVQYSWFSEMTALNYLFFGLSAWQADGISSDLKNLRSLRKY